MADEQDLKKRAVIVLNLIGEVTSFVSSIHPIFEYISSLVKVAQRALEPEQSSPLEKDFKEINTKLRIISEKNQQIMKDVVLNEVIDNYGELQNCIKYQYNAFVDAAEKAIKYPENTRSYMDEFEKVYESQRQDESLDALYRGVTGQSGAFGRPVLKVYQESYNGDRDQMEHICSHFMYLFQIGLIAHMGYTVVTEDDEDQEEKKWTKKVIEIHQAMEDVLLQCEDTSS